MDNFIFTTATEEQKSTVRQHLEKSGALDIAPIQNPSYQLLVADLKDGLSLGLFIAVARLDLPDTTGHAFSMRTFNLILDRANGGVTRDVTNVDAFILE